MEVKITRETNREISFKSYVWNTKTDLIGSGATSKVYKARCMTSGNLYAVKVFDENARFNTQLQQRELDLLSKINHKNVVKFIDKDEETVCERSIPTQVPYFRQLYSYSLNLKDRFNRYFINAIVMEYCNGSSLATIIEKPENYYGLQQYEYLVFLKHLTDGIRELNRLGIAHRDVKPNNILLQILPNGEHIYKLTDFGAAKEIEGEELFNSVVGTEEYLYPGLYAKAFYRNASGNKFKADVDLWSIGVTLYHTATGELPFRAYGGRSNHDGMLNILKSKKSGQISGIQRRPYGPIEYGTKLPKACQLSDNLQEILIPMLAGLMENDPKQMWSFEKFFQYSTEITERVFINCIDVNKCDLFEISFKSEQKLVDLKQTIKEKTDLNLDSQLLVYNNLFLNSLVNPEQNIDKYPVMDNKNPLVIFTLNNKITIDKTKILVKKAPEPLRLNITKINELYGWCKQLLADLYVVHRELHKYSLVIDVLKSSAITCKLHISELKLKQENLLEKFKYTIRNLKTKLSIGKLYDNILPQLEEKKGVGKGLSGSEQYSLQVDKLFMEITEYERQINLLSNKIENPRNLETLMKDLVTVKCKTHVDSIVTNVQQTFDDLLVERDEARRSTTERDRVLTKINTFQLNNLKNFNESTQELYEKTFKQYFFDFITKYTNWLNDLVIMKKDIIEIEKKLIEYGKKLEILQKSIDNDSEPKAKKIDDLLSSLIKIKSSTPSPVTTIAVNTNLTAETTTQTSIATPTHINVNKNLSNSRTNLNVAENMVPARPLPLPQPSQKQPSQAHTQSSALYTVNRPPYIGFESLLYGNTDSNNNNDNSSYDDNMNTLRTSAFEKIEILTGGRRF